LLRKSIPNTKMRLKQPNSLTRWGPLFVLCLLIYQSGLGQEAISSSGTTLENSNYMLEVGVGETIIDTYSDTSGSLTTGVLQPVLILTAINDREMPLTSIVAYPNPFSTQLNFQSDASIERVQVINMLGTVIHNNNMNGRQSIETMDWKPGNYIVRAWTHGASIPTTFQLIKTH